MSESLAEAQCCEAMPNLHEVAEAAKRTRSSRSVPSCLSLAITGEYWRAAHCLFNVMFKAFKTGVL